MTDINGIGKYVPQTDPALCPNNVGYDNALQFLGYVCLIGPENIRKK